jgi:hypothetical protein
MCGRSGRNWRFLLWVDEAECAGGALSIVLSRGRGALNDLVFLPFHLLDCLLLELLDVPFALGIVGRLVLGFVDVEVEPSFCVKMEGCAGEVAGLKVHKQVVVAVLPDGFQHHLDLLTYVAPVKGDGF